MTLTAVNAIAVTSPELVAQVISAVEADGYAVITDVLSSDECAALIDEVHRVEAEYGISEGVNEFEGFATRRIFNLIGKSELFRNLVIRETTLPLIEAILGVDPLLSGTTSMNIGPGETPQLLHADDGMITLPRPHHPTMVTTLWALSDFRADNGATHFVPGSHLFPTVPRPGEQHEVATADMPAGSVLLFNASLWHGGGHNTTTDERRYGLSIQYVAGWCRQQQNLMLGTDPETVATYPRRLQELIGYSMYKNVMGHVDRENPLKLLGVDIEPNMVWDKMSAE